MNETEDEDESKANSTLFRNETKFGEFGEANPHLQHFAHGLLTIDKEFYVSAAIFTVLCAVPPGLFIVIQILR